MGSSSPIWCRQWLVLALLCLIAGVADAKRLALVIGNAEYRQLSVLGRAGADADAVSRELESAGFKVSLQRDVSFRIMGDALEAFLDSVNEGDELVVFYVGHGVQTERGLWMLPADFEGDTQSQVEGMSYPVNGLLDRLARKSPRIALVIVDASRDNPMRVRGKSIAAAGVQPGFDVAKGQMLILSTGRNQKALDSLGPNDGDPNGLFTRELLKRMRVPGQSIETMAMEVRQSVERLAATASHAQRPQIISDLAGEFMLYPGARAQGAKASAIAPSAPGR